MEIHCLINLLHYGSLQSVNTFTARFPQLKCSIYLLPTIPLQASLHQHVKTLDLSL